MANNRKLTVFEAAHQNDEEELRRHLHTGVNPESTHDPIERRTPLHWAVVGRSENIVQLLLDRRPEKIDHEDKDGKSPVQLCGEDPASIQIRNLLYRYQQFLSHRVYTTGSPSQKNGCCWKRTRLQTFGIPSALRDTIHLCLVHHSINDPHNLNWSFDVKRIHQELSASVNEQTGNAGNDVCAALTFQISINAKEHTGVTIPIRVSSGRMCTRSQAADGRVYTRTQAERDVHGSRHFLALLKCYSRLGRQVGGRFHVKHGHQPSYESNESSGMQQHINHSEQTLAVYLSTETAAQYFYNALVIRLRSSNSAPLNSKIRIYSITVHIHSTKTPCGACEFVLVGMMNATTEPNNEAHVRSMSEQFESTFVNNRQFYQFFFGEEKQSGNSPSLNLFTTFTANSGDGTHRTEWSYNETNYEDLYPTLLNTKDRANSSRIFICRFRHFVRSVVSSNLLDYTVFVSASDSNSTIPKKQQSIKRVLDAEMEKLCGSMKHLRSDNQYEIPDWTLDNEMPEEIITDFERGGLFDGSGLTINGEPLRLVTSLIIGGGKQLIGIPGKTSTGEMIYLIRRVRGG